MNNLGLSIPTVVLVAALILIAVVLAYLFGWPIGAGHDAKQVPSHRPLRLPNPAQPKIRNLLDLLPRACRGLLYPVRR
jgi:hypothetical protein